MDPVPLIERPRACQILCGRVGVTSTAWGRGAWRITHDFRTDNNECNDDDGR